MHVHRPSEFSVGGTSKKARKNRYRYQLVVPHIGVYRAPRTDSKPFWLWQDDTSGKWYAGEELSSPMTSEDPTVFDDSRISVLWMSKEQVTQPGAHRWSQWSDKQDRWLDPEEYTTEVKEDPDVWEQAYLVPGVQPKYGWYDPNLDLQPPSPPRRPPSPPRQPPLLLSQSSPGQPPPEPAQPPSEQQRSEPQQPPSEPPRSEQWLRSEQPPSETEQPPSEQLRSEQPPPEPEQPGKRGSVAAAL